MLIGIVLTVVGSLLLAGMRIAVRAVLSRGTVEQERPSESALLAVVMTTACLVLGLAFVIVSGDVSIQPGFWWAVCVTGVLNVGISYCTFQALKREQASIVVPIADTTPVAVVLVALLFTGERPNLLGYLGIVLLVFGTYTLNVHELVEKWHEGRWSLRTFFAPISALSRSSGVRYALASALMGCIAVTCDGIAARRAHPLFTVSIILTFPAVIHTTRMLYQRRWSDVADRQRLMPWAGVGIGCLFATAVGLYFFSFRFLLIAYQATLKRIETLFVLGLAYVILHEKKNMKTRFIAVLFLIAGATFISWKGK